MSADNRTPRWRLDREGCRIIVAIQDGRFGTNKSGRYVIRGEERPDRRTRELLAKRGLIDWTYTDGFRWFVTPEGEEALRRDLRNALATETAAEERSLA